MADRETPSSAVQTPQTRFTSCTPATIPSSSDVPMEPRSEPKTTVGVENPDDRLTWEAYGLLEPEKHGGIAPFWRQDKLRQTSYVGTLKGEAAWDDEPQVLVDSVVHRRLAPGLRLAGMLLMHSESFMTKVLCADIKRNTAYGLFDWIQLDPTYKCTEADKAKYRRCLIDVAQGYRVFLGYHDQDHTCNADNLYGWTSVTSPDETGARVHVSQIHPTFLAFFSRADYDYLDIDLKLRILFSFAVTLVHEITHVIFDHRKYSPHLRGTLHPTIPDDFWEQRRQHIQFHTTSLEMELGRAWEHFCFGGIVGHESPDGTLDCMQCTAVSSLDWFYCRFAKRVSGLVEAEAIEDDVVRSMFDWALWRGRASDDKVSAALDGGSLEVFAVFRAMLADRSSEESSD